MTPRFRWSQLALCAEEETPLMRTQALGGGYCHERSISHCSDRSCVHYCSPLPFVLSCAQDLIVLSAYCCFPVYIARRSPPGDSVSTSCLQVSLVVSSFTFSLSIQLVSSPVCRALLRPRLCKTRALALARHVSLFPVSLDHRSRQCVRL